MNQLCTKAWSKAPLAALLAALLILVLLPAGCSRSSQPVTIRLAGDDWFLKSLTKTGMIAAYEAENRHTRGSTRSQ